MSTKTPADLLALAIAQKQMMDEIIIENIDSYADYIESNQSE